MGCPDEAKLQSLTSGRLAESERDALLLHVEECEACRKAVAVMIHLQSETATPTPRSKEAPRSAIQVGRFELGAELGAGGLGVVFEANDPVLGRKVAIKLVRGVLLGNREHTERLLREAQTMAQVSHPNVVTAYEAGRQGDDVYIAMELVTGGTLKTWLQRPQPPEAVLARLLEAGEGLCAAHAKGLIHRDFKPENVLIDALGHARVADFGLARGSLERLEASTVSPDHLASPVTVTGALVGTPAYMAPEQLDARPVDARADQFAYCVTLYEALAGVRPHSGRTVKELRACIEAQRWAAPRSGHIIDARTRAVLTRGLAARPDERFESMRALLTALHPSAPRRSRWVLGGIAAAVALAVIAGGGLAFRRRSIEAECARGLAHLSPVWSPERAAGLNQAFGAVPHPYAAQSLQQTRATVEAWVSRWTSSWEDACRAARLDGLQSPQTMDLRFACLDSRRSELDAMLSVLSRVDAASIVKAPAAVDGLGRVELCADTAFLLAAAKGPRSDTSPEAQSVRAVVREAVALTELAKLDDATARAQEALKLAQASKRRGLEAEAGLALGRALAAKRAKVDAIAPLEKAVEAALASGHDEVAFAAWRQLAFTEGYDQSKFEEAFKRLGLAQAAMERLGSPLALKADLAFTRGAVQLKQGALPDADRSLGEALAIYRQSGERMTAARALNNLATVKSQQDDLVASMKYQREAIEVMTSALGEGHPNIALLTMNVGVDQLNGGDPAAAVETFTRALTLARKAFGAEHPSVFATLLNRGKAFTALERYPEARADLEAALQGMRDGKAPPDDVAQGLQSLAVYASATGDYERALSINQEALALREASVGKDAAATGVSLNNTANALLMLGREREALPLYQRALAIFAKTLPPEHTSIGHALQGEGAALLALAKPKEALVSLELARVFVDRDEKGHGRRTVGLAGHLARAQAAVGETAKALVTLSAVEPQLADLPVLLRGQHFAAKAEVLWAARQSSASRDAVSAAQAAFKQAGLAAEPEAQRLEAWCGGHACR